MATIPFSFWKDREETAPPDPPFDPLTAFPGIAPVAWYDASDSIVSSGGVVTEWLDKAERANAAIPFNGNPAAGTGYGGNPAVLWTGSQSLRQTTYLLPFETAYGWTGPFYYFLVTSGPLADGSSRLDLYFGCPAHLQMSNYGGLVAGSGLSTDGVGLAILGESDFRVPITDKLADTFVIEGIGSDRTTGRRTALARQDSPRPAFLSIESANPPPTSATCEQWEQLVLGGAYSPNAETAGYYELLVYNQALTDNQYDAIITYLRDKWLPDLKNAALFVGDSITNGYTIDTATAFPAVLMADKSNFESANVGITGARIAVIETQVVRYAPLFRAGKTNIAVLMAGLNDIVNEIGTAQDVHDHISTTAGILRSQGWDVIVMDLTSASLTGDQETRRQAVNALLLADHTTFCDGFVQLSADSRIGSPTSWTNGTYFMDIIHPSAAGHSVISSLLAPVFAAL